jgi:hypothetical protein
MERSVLYRQNSAFIPRRIADEMILIPLQSDAGSLDAVYALNETACLIWDLLDGQNSRDDILKKLAENFQATEEDLARDLDAFIEDCRKIRAIEVVSS